MGRRPVSPAAEPKDVLVVGAGPAGLEAARVAAERGHRVEIVEALPVVGGQFRLAGMQPRRGQILDLMDWYERQFDKLGVRLRLNTFLEEEELAAHPADGGDPGHRVACRTRRGSSAGCPQEASLAGDRGGRRLVARSGPAARGAAGRCGGRL